MSSKFSNEDIKEISSKLKWKPNKLSYNIYYLVVSLSIFSFILVIYLIALHSDLKCKFSKLKKINIYMLNKILDLEDYTYELSSFTNNNIRYLTKRSERNSDNLSLSEKNSLPKFSNEIESGSLFSALQGL